MMSARVVDIRSERRKEVLENIGWDQFLMPVKTTRGRAVLLHGYDDKNETLSPLKVELKDRHVSYVAPDLPGHGVSANGNPGYFHDILELELVARSLTLYLMKSLEQRQMPVILVGFSMGALVILSLLINRPVLRNCIAGVVLIGTPLEVRQNSVPFMRNMRFALSVASRAFGRRVPPEFFINKKLRNGTAAAAGNTAFSARPPLRVINQLVTCSLYVQENLHRLEKVPICAIHGTEDLKADFATAEQSFQVLKGAWFSSIDGLDHYPWGTEFESTVVNTACDWMQERIDMHRRP